MCKVLTCSASGGGGNHLSSSSSAAAVVPCTPSSLCAGCLDWLGAAGANDLGR